MGFNSAIKGLKVQGTITEKVADGLENKVYIYCVFLAI
jgi:hypothetical protein